MKECNSQPVLKSCPECQSKKLTYGGYGNTLLGCYSPPGHDHDNNCKIHYWKCENGHDIRERQINVCPAEGCNWTSGQDCFCSPLGAWIAKMGPGMYQ